MSESATALPVLPVKNTVLFPHVVLPLGVSRAGSLAAVEAAAATEDKVLAVFTQKDPDEEKPGPDDLYEVGCLGIIKRMVRSEGGVQLVVQGSQRVERTETVAGEGGYLTATVAYYPEPEDHGPQVDALDRSISELVQQMVENVDSQTQAGLNHVISEIEDPLYRAYLLASIMSLDVDKAQTLLRAQSREEALRLIHDYLGHEVQVQELRQKIASQAHSEMSRQQREHLLRQQMRAIQEELGGESPEQQDANELRKRLDEADLPDVVRNEVDKELSRLERQSVNAPDYQMTRGYIETVLELPWRKVSEDVLDLQRARGILDHDHYDLDDVKQRIVEHLAVMKLNPEAKSPILCFVGPPGVGKTSLGQSIARSLGRSFERISLGGLHDEAELRGHRRTYIGAMPGRIIRSIRRAGVKNPVLMLDEIDKLGRDFRGDPAAALMEILDPEQNVDFHDNYLDLPFDLSQVLFIGTANTLDTVPSPLLDRLEVLRLSGYSDEEKCEIARRYLIERQITQAGLSKEQLTIPDDTLQYLIRRYTREAGLRELERQLGRIARKIATRVAEGDDRPATVQRDDLPEMLGAERFFPEEARRELAAGTAAGLAWTESGGDVLYVEAALLPEGKDLILTGHLGTVMQESAKAARSHIWAHADELGIEDDRIRNTGVHIHVPAGAIPKDGPSAGVTMAAGLASLYSGWPVRADTAMTGEITLSGLVLPVGGVKEKVLAAHRAGIRRVVLPKANEKDLRDIPENVQHDLTFVHVENIHDLLVAVIDGMAHHLRHTANYRRAQE